MIFIGNPLVQREVNSIVMPALRKSSSTPAKPTGASSNKKRLKPITQKGLNYKTLKTY
jgi:hypothetical protein